MKLFIIGTSIMLGVCSLGYSNDSDSLSEVKSQLKSLESVVDRFDERGEKSGSSKMVLRTNLQFLENSVQKKLRRAESKLEKYKEMLQESQDNEEVQEYLEKIQTAEKQIKDINDIITIISILKERLI